MSVSSKGARTLGAALLCLSVLIVPFLSAGNGDDVILLDGPLQRGSAKRAPVVQFVRDEGNIAIIQFGGDYNRDLPDGSTNWEARAAVAEAFYAQHGDAFDFLVVMTSFEWNSGDAQAFYMGVYNDIEGIGTNLFDNRSAFGGSNALQGFIDMAAYTRYQLDPLQPGYDSTLDTLLHETMHRWGVRVSFNDENGQPSEELLGYQNAHWGQYIDSDASLMGGGKWRDNGDGSFSAQDVRYHYNPLDLYLAGFLPADKVPDFFFLREPDGDPDAYWPAIGDVTGGTRVNVSVDQIIAAEGPRQPAFDQAQRSFRAGFIMLLQPNEAPHPLALAAMNDLQREYRTRFSVLTHGQGQMLTHLEAKPEVTVGLPTPVTGGEHLGLSADYDKGIAFLLDQQDDNGWWADHPATRVRDTTLVLQALSALAVSNDATNTARTRLRNHLAINNDERARILESGVLAGASLSAAETLIAARNEDGGWGPVPGTVSNPFDTALVLRALVRSGFADQAVLDAAAAYLLSVRLPGAGWGHLSGGESKIATTARALIALDAAGVDAGELTEPVSWLLARQNANGTFGQDEGSGHETAQVLDGLGLFAVPATALDGAATALEARQTEDGSWSGSVYATARALLALRGRQNPNLSLGSALTPSPTDPVDGDSIDVTFSVRNDGLFSTAEVFTRLYLGNPTSGGVPVGTSVAVPALEPGESFSGSLAWDSFGNSGSIELYVWVDADELLTESNEGDNLRSLTLEIAAPDDQADVALLSASLSYAPLAISSLPTTLDVSVALRNLATQDAGAIEVALFLDNGGELIELARQTVDAVARATQSLSLQGLVTRPDFSAFRVIADPDNTLAERNESNNGVSFKPELVNSLDLVVLDQDLNVVTATPRVGSDVQFALTLRNQGTVDAPLTRFRVSIERAGISEIIAEQDIQLRAGEVSERVLAWRATNSGSHRLIVELDPNNDVVEGNEGNNEAELSFEVQTLDIPNLIVDHEEMVFNSLPALEGQPLSVSIPVRNTADVAAAAFSVRLYEGLPSQGGELRAELELSEGLAAGAETSVELVTPALTGGGDRLFYLVVDEDGRIAEFSEDDNDAFAVIEILRLPDLAVSTANLALQPAIPVPGTDLSVTVTVDNLGQQPAENVSVALAEANASTELPAVSGTIARIEAGASASITLTWTFGLLADVDRISAVIDGADSVPEYNEGNNVTSVRTELQDRSFYATERYISPNGDGSQDQTELVFDRENPITEPRIEIIDGFGEIQRSFDGFASGMRGTQFWGGRNGAGVLVRDGEYQVRLLDGEGVLHGSLLVTVDTNRSPLLNAVGTSNAYITDLRCSVNESEDRGFGADGRTIFARNIIDKNDESLRGLFRIAARGRGVDSPVSESWLEYVSTPLGTGSQLRSYYTLDDGRIVFVTADSTSCYNCEGGLWLKQSASTTPMRLNLDNVGSFRVLDASTEGIYLAGQFDGEYRIGFQRLLQGVPPQVLQSPSYPEYEGSTAGGLIMRTSNEGDWNGEYRYMHTFWFVSRDPDTAPVELVTAPLIRLAISNDGRYMAVQSGDINQGPGMGYTKAYDVSGTSLVPLFDQSEEFAELWDRKLAWSPANELLVLDGPSASGKLYERSGRLTREYSLPTNLFTEYLATVPHDFAGYDFAACPSWFAPSNHPSPVRWNGDGTEFFVDFGLSVYNCFSAPEKAGKRNPCGGGGGEPSKSAVGEFEGGSEYRHVSQWYRIPKNGGEPILIGAINYLDDPDVVFPHQLGDLRPSLVEWPAHGDDLVLQSGEGIFALTLRPEVSYRILDLGNAMDVWPNRAGVMPKKMLLEFLPGSDEFSCAEDGFPVFVLESAENLIAHLDVSQIGLLVELRGVAADKHLRDHQLEWASVDSPEVWHPLTSPSAAPVVDDVLTTWVPPGPGSYYARLTVTDKAGNRETAQRTINWFDPASLTGVMAEPRFISPNGDGTGDAVTLNFQVLQPLHLDVTIEDSFGALVRVISGDYPAVTGAIETLIWDGRDDAGRIVPDGDYLMRVQNRRYKITVDNTAPVVDLTLPLAYRRDFERGIVESAYELLYEVEEANLAEGIIEFRVGSDRWNPLSSIAPSPGLELYENSRSPLWLGRDRYVESEFRLTVVDHAGNQGRISIQVEEIEAIMVEMRQYSLRYQLERQALRFQAKPFEYFPLNDFYASTLTPALKLEFTGRTQPDAAVLEYALASDPDAWYDLNTVVLDPAAPENTTSEGLPGGDAHSPYRYLLQFSLEDLPLLSGRLYLRCRFDVAGEAIVSNGFALEFGSGIYLGEINEDLERAAKGQLSEQDTIVLRALLRNAPIDEERTYFWMREDLIGDPLHPRLLLRSDDDLRYTNVTAFLPVHAYVEEDGATSALLFEVVTSPCYSYKADFEAEFLLSNGEQRTFNAAGPGADYAVEYERSCLEINTSVGPVLGDFCAATPSDLVGLSLLLTTDRGEIPTLLRVYAKDAAGNDVLLFNQVDPDVGNLYELEIPTDSLSEGLHDLRVEALDSVGEKVTRYVRFPVDRRLPTASLDYPAENEQVCAEVLPDGTIVLPLEGLIRDDYAVVYKVEIGNGHEVPAYKSIEPATKVPSLTSGQARDNYFGELAIYYDPHPETGMAGWLESGPVTARIHATDWSGADVCVTRHFFLDVSVDATVPSSFGLFSPNYDGDLDLAELNLVAFEPLMATVEVFRASIDSKGRRTVVGNALATLVDGLPIGGEWSYQWDGTDGGGQVLDDGLYALAFQMTDPCGLVKTFYSFGEIDNTPPELVIDYPLTGDPLPAIVEIVGRFDDRNFVRADLSYARAEANPTWLTLAHHPRPVEESEVIGNWPISGLNGQYLLRLEGVDKGLNRAELIVPIEIQGAEVLIWAADAQPRLFSPNDDTRKDLANITVGLQIDAELTVTIQSQSGAHVRTLLGTGLQSAGTVQLQWDGTDDGGNVVADGIYELIAYAQDPNTVGFNQTEQITLTVDNTAPTVTLENPADTVVPGVGSFVIEVDDAHFERIRVNLLDLEGGAETALIDAVNKGTQRAGDLSELFEQDYRLTLVASDLAGNIYEFEHGFTIDNTPPVISLDSPLAGAVIGGAEARTQVLGSVEDLHFAEYRLGLRDAGSEDDWTNLFSATTLPEEELLYDWAITQEDRRYELRLSATDAAGWESEQIIEVVVDTTPPTVALTAPADGAAVRAGTVIRGSATDANFKHYKLRIAPAGTQAWSDIAVEATPVEDGVLLDWVNLPPDGLWALQLMAEDIVGLTAETGIQLRLDTQPPEPAIDLAGEMQPNFYVVLTWTASSSDDVAGYHIYRAGTAVAQVPATQTSYTDPDVPEGEHDYHVIAVDAVGNTSVPSNTVTVPVDRTPPTVTLIEPEDERRVRGLLEIIGTATSADDFSEWRLYVRAESDPEPGTLLRQSPQTAVAEVLNAWDSQSVTQEAWYVITLQGEDTSGNLAQRTRRIYVDNQAPAAPTGLVADVPAGQSDATVTWNPNSEGDLAGYLLYRDGQLVNADGPLGDDLRTYALTDTNWLDEALDDGEHTYVVHAIDQAANLSQPSAPAAVTVETGPPDLVIVTPEDGHRFEGPLYILADSENRDIAEVLFEVADASAPVWTALAAPDTDAPYDTSFNPEALGLEYGDYLIRATATDEGGLVDPTPAQITVSYGDLTPPAKVIGLAATVDGGDVRLSWTASEATDLLGYTIYRAYADDDAFEFWDESATNEYVDLDVNDGPYRYQVRAIDTSDNESIASDTVSALVHTPSYEQPYTPTVETSFTVVGQSVIAGTVLVSLNGSPLDPVATEEDGNFTLADLPLALGDQELSLRIDDGDGNLSKTVTVPMQHGLPPEAPTNPVIAVNGEQVDFTWDAPAGDLLGYRVYREGEPVVEDQVLSSGITYSASTTSVYASRVSDSRYYYYWYPSDSDLYYPPSPWHQSSFDQARLVTSVRLEWYSSYYSAHGFSIQGWSGAAWVTLARVTDNDETNSNNVTLDQPYLTDRLRIVIEDFDRDRYRPVRLSYLQIYHRELTVDTSWSSDEYNGRFAYRVAAVSNYGFEGPQSDPAVAEVGDVEGPPAVVLDGSVDQSQVSLSWTESVADDLAGYQVFRDGEHIATVVDPRTFSESLPNGEYSYTVTAVDNFNNLGPASNVVTLTVAVPEPDAPINLTVSADPEGGSLDLAWQVSVATPDAAYLVKRAEVSGGPYQLITVTGNLALRDEGLVNGTTYYYVVTTVDANDNESEPSNEASGTPRDETAPGIPVISGPTVAGIPYTTRDAVTDISGSAEPGVSVEIYRGNSFMGRTETSYEMSLEQSFSPTYLGDVSVSPDGRYLFRGSSPDTIIDRIDGTTVSLPTRYSRGAWSGDGKSIILSGYEIMGEVPRYGLDGNLIEIVHSQHAVEFAVPSPDDHYLAIGGNYYHPDTGDFESNVIVVDRQSGEWQILDGVRWVDVRIDTVSWSPDSTQLAFTYNGAMHLYDPATEQLTNILASAGSTPPAWSPTGDRLAFEAYDTNGYYQINVYELADDSVTQLTNAPFTHRYAIWSPDGRYVGYMADYEILEIYDLEANDIVDGLFLGYPESLTWLSDGRILATEYDTYSMVRLPGHFLLPEMPLLVGQNLVTAVAVDEADNSSLPSQAIEIIVPTEGLPDLAISTGELSVLPASGLTDDTFRLNLIVRNLGDTASEPVGMALRLTGPDGTNRDLLDGQSLGAIAAGGTRTFAIELEPEHALGVWQVTAVVDPRNELREISDANNSARAEYRVLEQLDPALTVLLDRTEFPAGQFVTGGVEVYNPGATFSGLVTLTVRDAYDYQVASLPSVTVTELGSSEAVTLPVSWDPGDLFAGIYQLRARLFDQQGGEVDSVTSSFTLGSSAQFALALDGARTTYASGERVDSTLTIRYLEGNTPVQDALINFEALAEDGSVVFFEEQDLATMLPGFEGQLDHQWDLAGVAPGAYRLRAELSSQYGAASSERVITVLEAQQQLRLDGSITLSSHTIAVDQPFDVSYRVSNAGDLAVDNVPLTLTLLRSANVAEVNRFEHTIALSSGQDVSFSERIPAGTLAFEGYLLLLRADLSAFGGSATTTLASTSVTGVDAGAPVIAVQAPGDGQIVRGDVTVIALVNDALSLVDSVRVRLDGGIEQAMGRGGAEGRYSKRLIAPAEGEHRFIITAEDTWSNQAQSTEYRFVVDNTAPLIQITGVVDGQLANTLLTPVIQVTDAHPGTTVITLDGEVFTSGSEITADGVYQLNVVAVDVAGNSNTATIGFTIDRTPPELTVTYPSPNEVVLVDTIPVSGTTEPGASVSLSSPNFSGSVVADGSGAFEFTGIGLDEGANALVLQATDAAGNSGTQVSLTVTYELPVAEVSGTLTVPAELGIGETLSADISLQNTGTLDLVDLPVRLDVIRAGNGAVVASSEKIYNIPRDQGQSDRFDFATDSYTPGNYRVELTATVEGEVTQLAVGSVSITDTIAPLVALTAPVAGVLYGPDTVVEATASDAHGTVAEVSYSLDGGAWVGMVLSDAATGSYAANLSALADGNHSIAVRATDDRGNQATTATISFQVDALPPVISVTGVVDGELRNSAVTPVIDISDANPAEETLSLDGVPYIKGEAIEADGFHELRITATDAVGNSALLVIGFEIDTQAPVVVISAPADGTVTPEATVAVVGTTEAHATVVLVLGAYSVTVQSAADGSFRFDDVALADGENAIEVSATDRAGNLGAITTVHVTRESGPLPLVVDAPSDGAEVTTATVNASGSTLPGAEVSADNAGETVTTVAAGDGSWTMAVPVRAGVNNLVFTAVLNGRESEAVHRTVNGDCAICSETAIVVDEASSVDFSQNPPVFDGDPDLEPFFSYNREGSVPSDWRAVFDLAGHSLLLEAPLSVEGVDTGNGVETPGIEIRGGCRIEVAEEGVIGLLSDDRDSGDLRIEARGDLVIAGELRNENFNGYGLTGSIQLLSQCGDLHLAQSGRVVLYGSQVGGGDIELNTARGDILVEGLVDASFAWNRSPNIRLTSAEGGVLIDGRSIIGRGFKDRPLTGGLNLWSRGYPGIGDITIEAAGDIQVLGYGAGGLDAGDTARFTLDDEMRGGEAVPAEVVLVNSAPDTVTVTVTIAEGDGHIRAFFGNLLEEALLASLVASGETLSGKQFFSANGVNGIPNYWMSPPGNWDFGLGILTSNLTPITEVIFELTAPGLSWEHLLGDQSNGWSIGLVIEPLSGGLSTGLSGNKNDNFVRSGLRSPLFQHGVQYGAVAVKPKNGAGGNIRLHSFAGRILLQDHALDGAAKDNSEATISLEACGDIELTSANPALAELEGGRVVVDGSATAQGAANRLRSHDGHILIDRGAVLSAEGAPDGSNELISCQGVLGDGEVFPADTQIGDDDGVCADPQADFYGAPPPTSARVGQTLLFDFAHDGPANPAAVFLLVSGPRGMTLSDQGTLSWRPEADQVGSHSVTVKLVQACRHSDLTFELTVGQ